VRLQTYWISYGRDGVVQVHDQPPGHPDGPSGPYWSVRARTLQAAMDAWLNRGGLEGTAG